MENNKFFKFLWRANAVFLFFAGIGLICLLCIFAVVLIAESRSWNSSPPPISASADKNSENEVFELRHNSDFAKTLGSDFTYFDLRSGTDSYGSLSYSSSQLRNIGVFNLKTDKTHWVFPDQQQDIEQFRSVGKTRRDEVKDKSLNRTGFILTVAKSLDNKSIVRDVWVMRPDGQDLRKILSDVATSPSIRTYGDNQKKLIIETKTHIDVYPFDVDMLTVGEPTRVSMP